MKILIAEDDLAFQCLLAALVTKWGHEPVVASNGLEAWEYLQAPDGPRLALLDWVMPGLNGIDVCRQIRSRAFGGYTYVIIITAKTEQQDAIRALEAGSDDIITKPFHHHELRARINTAQRILALEESLSRQAFYDHLTGLPNRTLLAERFRKSADRAARNGEMLALLYIDLDHFKTINDSLGHAAGDVMLREITGRLNHDAGESEILARAGGDEFVYLANVQTRADAVALATRVRESLRSAMDANGHGDTVRASIGISLFPHHGDDFDVLLQNADAAMYDAKRQRRGNGFQFFNEEIGDRHHRRLMLETRLPGALRRSEFFLLYQPIFRLNDMHMAGSEALIRWDDPARGLILPTEFIPIAEETGYIAEIGEWVMYQACRQAKQWEANGDTGFRVTVNISASQFSDSGLIDTVSGTLDRTGASPGMLELEMTETALVGDLEKSAATMRALRQLGVRVSLDDFGTGYSSLSYLANLPIDTLKIDRSFLAGIHCHLRRSSVLEAIVVLAHKLDIVVVAEGIEDENQLNAVRDAGCDEVQGFLFAGPGLPGSRRMNGFIMPEEIQATADLGALAGHLLPEGILV
jgi:diguanylate cyclase (GGDEF)-like protein